MDQLALFYHPEYLEHDTGQHPERIARLQAIARVLEADGLTAAAPFREPPPAPHYARFDLREDAHARAGADIYRDGTLFHGPAFQGVGRLLNASQTGLTLACRLPALDEATQGQFPARRFNPYVADAQFQAQVIWGRLFHDAASLPLSCRRGEQYLPLPFDQTL